jgi:hypothetical protein
MSFEDRDMLMAGSPDTLAGYTIAQPTSRLHFPQAHDISATGGIGNFFHRQYAPCARGQCSSEGLLQAAEASFKARAITTALVVCPNA